MRFSAIAILSVFSSQTFQYQRNRQFLSMSLPVVESRGRTAMLQDIWSAEKPARDKTVKNNHNRWCSPGFEAVISILQLNSFCTILWKKGWICDIMLVLQLLSKTTQCSVSGIKLEKGHCNDSSPGSDCSILSTCTMFPCLVWHRCNWVGDFSASMYTRAIQSS